MSDPDSLPLFPLPLVLFPGARLPLRIFESRYLDMVRECGRKGTGFGVVWSADRTQAAAPASPVTVGTEAMIEDFSLLEDGLLGIQCRGNRRFRIRHSRAEADGLLRAEIDWLHQAPRLVPPEFGALQSMLREILARPEFADVIRADPDEAGSLGMALAALLPFDRRQAQALLEIEDPVERLVELVTMLDSLPESADPSD